MSQIKIKHICIFLKIWEKMIKKKQLKILRVPPSKKRNVGLWEAVADNFYFFVFVRSFWTQFDFIYLTQIYLFNLNFF
jgi:hypothetical protein